MKISLGHGLDIWNETGGAVISENVLLPVVRARVTVAVEVRNSSKPGEFGGQLMTADSRVFRSGAGSCGVEFWRCRQQRRHHHVLPPASCRQSSCLGPRFRSRISTRSSIKMSLRLPRLRA